MTDRLASPDAHLGLVDSIAAWLFPSLYPNLPETDPRPASRVPGISTQGPAAEPEMEIT